jgi:hypothetical protein
MISRALSSAISYCRNVSIVFQELFFFFRNEWGTSRRSIPLIPEEKEQFLKYYTDISTVRDSATKSSRDHTEEKPVHLNEAKENKSEDKKDPICQHCGRSVQPHKSRESLEDSSHKTAI